MYIYRSFASHGIVKFRPLVAGKIKIKTPLYMYYNAATSDRQNHLFPETKNETKLFLSIFINSISSSNTHLN